MMRVFWWTSIGLLVVAGVLGLPIWVMALFSEGPTSEDVANHQAVVRLQANSGAGRLTIADVIPGNWKFACVGGEYLSDFDTIAPKYAAAHGHSAKPVDDFEGDIAKSGAWAIAVFDTAGNHKIWHMHEDLLSYRLAEDQAYGSCFEVDSKMRVLEAKFFDFPGRDDGEVSPATRARWLHDTQG